MARLQTIEPRPASIDPGTPRPINRTAGFDAISDAADIWRRAAFAGDAAETARVSTAIYDALDGQLQEASLGNVNASEFENDWRQRAERAMDDGLAGVSNERVRAAARDKATHYLRQFNIKATKAAFGKRQDAARRDVEDSFVSYSRQAIEGQSEQERGDAVTAYGNLIGQIAGVGFLSQEQAGEYLRRFESNVRQGRTSAFKIDLQERLDNRINAASTGTRGVNELMADGYTDIDSFTDMPKAERDGIKQRYKDALWTAAIEQQVQRDPVKAKKELDAGTYNDKIDQQSLGLLRQKADSLIEKMERERRALIKEHEAAVGEDVKDYLAAARSGLKWDGDIARLRREVQGTKHERNFRVAQMAEADMSRIALMSEREGRDFLNAMRRQPMSGEQIEVYKALESTYRETRQELDDDALGMMMKRGVMPSSVGAFDLNDPMRFKEREEMARRGEALYQRPIAPMEKVAAEEIARQYDAAGAKQKAQMLKKLADGYSEANHNSVGGVLAKQSASMAMRFELAKRYHGDLAVVTKVLQGDEVLKENRNVVFPETTRKLLEADIDRKIAKAYVYNPRYYEQVKNAALSYLAAQAWESGRPAPANVPDEVLALITGGVVTFRGSQIIAPFNGATAGDVGNRMRMADFSQLHPNYKPADILDRSDAVLESFTEGRYKVRIGDARVVSRDGSDFILDLRQGRTDEPTARQSSDPFAWMRLRPQGR